jgi:phage I-like protein
MPVQLGPTADRKAPRAPRIATLASKFETAKGEAPKEFRIFAAGTIPTKKGVFVFDEKSAESVMKHAEEYGNDFAVDYEHGMFSFISLPGTGAAAGWFTPEVRNGELWAVNVQWTDAARERLEAREYRYHSPTFRHESEGGRILELLNVALTNVPATKNHRPLMASVADLFNPVADDEGEETPPMTWKTLLTMLGLGENATEGEAIAVVTRERASIQTLLSSTGKPTLPEAVAVAQAWKVTAEGYKALSDELVELKSAGSKREMDVLVTEAKRSGKLTPAMEPHIRAMELSAAKAFVEALPVVVKPGKKEPKAGGVDVSSLSAIELEVASQVGLSPEQYAANKARRSGTVDVKPGTTGAPADDEDDE